MLNLWLFFGELFLVYGLSFFGIATCIYARGVAYYYNDFVYNVLKAIEFVFLMIANVMQIVWLLFVLHLIKLLV